MPTMLPNTKERALPAHHAQTLEDYLVYLKHVALYDFAAQACTQKNVLDLGCGEGYGSANLAQVARLVVAADYDFEAVAHARAKYSRANLAHVVCDAQALPFAPASFDTVVSFEVIEHIPDVLFYLREIKRVCTPDGTPIISTPNRLLRLLPFQKPWNHFHLREYDARALAQTVNLVFAQIDLCGITAVPVILDIEKRRVKQNPLIAYPKMIARMILPRAAYAGLRQLKQRLARPVQPHAIELNTSQFSAKDFCVTLDHVDASINLVVIGAREGKAAH